VEAIRKFNKELNKVSIRKQSGSKEVSKKWQRRTKEVAKIGQRSGKKKFRRHARFASWLQAVAKTSSEERRMEKGWK